MMIVAKAGLIGSTVGLISLAQIIPATVTNGKAVGELSALGIMGLCLVVCVGAIVTLYRDKEKDRVKIEKLLERCAIAMEAVKTSADTNTAVLVEMKAVIHKCEGH
jgi:hypothetical protein